jgi:superfamily II DNA or RNA helicase
MKELIMSVKPRVWQKTALKKFEEHDEKTFLLEATPGSGKTTASGFFANHLFEQNIINFALIAVPNTAIKGDEDAGFLGDWNKLGIQITTVLKDGKGLPSEFRGAVVTYQQLPNLVGTVATWVKNGAQICFIPDEIHHLVNDGDFKWGPAAESIAGVSKKIIAMTGTPFRGDRRRISFVEYDKDDKVVANHRYRYRDAVRDGVCREVEFFHDDSVTQFILNTNEHIVRVSEIENELERRGALNTIFRTDSDWLRAAITRADVKLDEYRTWDADAGGLVVCRPGFHEDDDRHLDYVAKLFKEVTEIEPVVVSYDDTDTTKITLFRKNLDRWMCAVRKVSEGVDIKRLRTLLMATCPTTELLFRQIVGRVLRVDDEARPGNATVFMPKFPALVEWAKNISAEAKQGIKDRDEDEGENDENGGGTPKGKSKFVPISASHEQGGATSDFGEQYTSAEINAAEQQKRGDTQLVDVPITKIAHLMRKLGVNIPEDTPPEEPLQIRKKRIRKKIVAKFRALTIRQNPNNPDYKTTFRTAITANFSARNMDDLVNNYSIDIMNQVLTHLSRLLGESE